MKIFHSFILGVIEGLTEFLPISSTAHLLIVNKILKIPQTDFQTFFDIVIQSGAIFSIIFLYFFYLFKNRYLWKNLFISFLPTALVGFLLEKIIKKVFFNSFLLIKTSLFFIGLIFIIFEILIQRKKIVLKNQLKEMDFFQAFLIGLSQSLAVVPGVSRAGIVILTMMILGFKRKESALYSFFLALPTIFAASFLELIKFNFSTINYSDFLYFLIGFFISFITAYFSAKWLINFLQKRSLIFFGVYRILLVIIMIIFGF